MRNGRSISLVPNIAKNAGAIRRTQSATWYWTLDVAYNEDNCRARADNAAIVFNLMRHLSLNLLSQEKTSKGGVKSKRLRCALSSDYLEKVLGIS